MPNSKFPQDKAIPGLANEHFAPETCFLSLGGRGAGAYLGKGSRLMVTKEEALTASTFYHVRERNADGTAVRCRANGKCKTWKTRPGDFRVPVKYGLKVCFYITHWNAAEWSTEDPVEAAERRARRAVEVGLREDAPEWMVQDAREEAGLE
jgi:hypothetical protein